MNKRASTTWSDNHPKEVRSATKRRSPRMNCRVPVSIEWGGGPSGSQRLDTAFTRVVNAYGCLLVSQKELDLQQRLRVTNLVTRQRAEAEVVWKGTHRPDGWDLGVKLMEFQIDFWGMDL